MGCLSRSLLATAIIVGLVLEGKCAGDANPSEHKEYNNRYYTTTIDKTSDNGKCIQEITIKGNGVDDKFSEPCVDDLPVMNTDEMLVIGNPKENPYSLMCFSDTANAVVVVKDGKCTLRMYSDDQNEVTGDSTTEHVATMAVVDTACADLQRKVNNLVQKSQGHGGKGDEDGEDGEDGEDSEDGEDGKDSEDDSDNQTGDENKLERKYGVVVSSSKIGGGKCIQEIRIQGNGVEDVFKGPCVKDIQVINRQEVMAVGNPEKDPFTIFSDRIKTLIIVKDGQCKKKYYETVNKKTTSTTSTLDDDECDEVKEKIQEVFGKKQSDKDNNNDGLHCKHKKRDGKLTSKFEVNTENSERKGKCIQEIKIEGNGVKDSFKGPCVNDLEIVNEKDALVVGNPDKNPFSIFSDKSNSLVIVKDGLCKEKSYKTVKGQTTSSTTQLDDDECEKIEEKIKKVLEKKQKTKEGDSQEESPFEVTTDTFERRGRCIENIKIKGNGIEDNFRGPCVDNLEIIKKKNILVVGDPDKNPFAFFSNEANTLVIIKDHFCKKRTYKTVNGKVTSTSTDLDDDECEEMEGKIAEELEKNRNKGDEEETSKYTVTTDTFKRRGKCYQNIKVEGNGVDDTFREPCVEDLEIVKTNVLIVGDPAKDPFSLFSDKPNSLITLKDGTCMEQTYKTVGGKTTSSSKELDDDECEEVENKIEKELKKKRNPKKDVPVKLSKYEVTTKTSERKGNCILEIKVEGNGVQDTFNGPCSKDLKTLKKDFLLVAYPDNEPFSVFGTEPNSLVVLRDGLCKQKTYKTVDGKTKSSTLILDDEECEKLEDTIEEKLSKN